MQDSSTSAAPSDRELSGIWSLLKNPWLVLVMCIIVLPGSWVGAGMLIEYRRQCVVDALSHRSTVSIVYRNAAWSGDVDTRLPVWLPELIGDRLPERWRPAVELVLVAHFSEHASDADVSLVNRLSDLRYARFDDAKDVSEDALRSCVERNNLRHLIFERARRLSASEFTALSQKTELTWLTKLAGPFDQHGIDALSGLAKLEMLELDGPATAANLVGIGRLPGLKTLNWTRSKLNDEQFAGLAPQRRIVTMHLGDTDLTSRSWPTLGTMSVNILSLDCPNIDDDALRELAKIDGLGSLTLRGGRITDAGVKELSAAPKLRELEIDTSELTVASAQAISRMPGFAFLRTPDGSAVTDEWLKELARRELAILSLPNARVTDAGVAFLSGEEWLRDLCLARTDITDNCFDTLRTLPRVYHLDLRFTEITDAGLKEFSARLRQTSVIMLAMEGTHVTEAAAREFLKQHPQSDVFGIEGIQPRSSADWILPLPGKKTP